MDLAHIEIDEPPHRDGTVEGAFAFFVSVCLASFGNVWLMPFYVEALAVLGVSLPIGWVVMRWIAKGSEKRRLEYLQNARSTPAYLTAVEVETQRKLAEAMASGAFDRWDK